MVHAHEASGGMIDVGAQPGHLSAQSVFSLHRLSPGVPPVFSPARWPAPHSQFKALWWVSWAERQVLLALWRLGWNQQVFRPYLLVHGRHKPAQIQCERGLFKAGILGNVGPWGIVFCQLLWKCPENAERVVTVLSTGNSHVCEIPF